jgi:hypothetical protein
MLTAAATETDRQQVTDPYHPGANSESFNLDGYLAQFDPRLLNTPEGRQVLTRLDPFLFAIVYMRRHLRNHRGVISFADCHFLWAKQARLWALIADPGPREFRDAYVAPRDTGKTTWWFLIIPMWAAAHGHAKFIAAFADSGGQSELHLATFKRELGDNVLLRTDYPDLCEPARRYTGKTVSDTQTMYYARSGFAMAAKGIDSTSLGMKIDEHRPTHIVFDDIEPPEGTYSEYQRQKRLSTFQNAILPLNERAFVTLIGTVTMPGSIVHALVRHSADDLDEDERKAEQWIVDENFKVHHAKPVLTRDDGSERSIWPEKWDLLYLVSIRHTRSYKMNFENEPVGTDGSYWTPDDYTYGRPDGITFELLSLDPSKSTKTTADFAGISVIGYAPARKGVPAQCCVEEAIEIRKVGEQLRLFLLEIIARRPRIRAILVEVNDGGEHWQSILHNMGVPVITVTQTEPKEVRAGNVLNLYQLGQVKHARKLVKLEQQQMSFPRAAHDDLVDSSGSGIWRLLRPRRRAGGETLHQR